MRDKNDDEDCSGHLGFGLLAVASGMCAGKVTKAGISDGKWRIPSHPISALLQSSGGVPKVGTRREMRAT